MNDKVTKEQLIALISEALADVEKAISEHPTNTISLYSEGKAKFMEGQDSAQETDWSREMGLTLPQLTLIHQYLFASAFMSAWYHLHGNKQKRDEASQSACLLVSGFGFKPEDAMHRYVQYEQAWRGAMRSSPNTNGSGGCLRVFLLAVAAIGTLTYWFMT